MRAWILLVLLSFATFAQPAVTRGGALKKRAYQTYATMSLFVDPTGSDSNPCTASGTAACLTVQGAINKLPRFIRHPVTVNIAAGTYAGTVTIEGFQITGAGFITVQGTDWVNVVPTTGSATGTLTGFSQATPLSGAVPGTMTDSGQTWTVGDLRGAFVKMTSGAAINTWRVVAANTSTALTFTSTISAAIGNTYALQVPAAVSTGAWVVTGNRGDYTGTTGIILSDLTISSAPTLTQAALSVADNFLGTSNNISSGVSSNAGVLFRRLRVLSSGAGAAATCISSRCQGSTQTNYFSNSSTGIAFSFYDGAMLDQGSYFKVTSGTAVNIVGGAWQSGAITGLSYVEATTGTGFSSVNQGAGVGVTLLLASTYLGTGTGLVSSVFSHLNVNSMSLTNATTGISVVSGGEVILAAVPTFTTVTNELSLDGTTYTSSFFNDLSPKVLTSPQGSSIHQ